MKLAWMQDTEARNKYTLYTKEMLCFSGRQQYLTLNPGADRKQENKRGSWSIHYPVSPRFPMNRVIWKCLKNTVSRAPSTIAAHYGMNMIALMILAEVHVLMKEWPHCCVKKPKTCSAHRLPARGNPPCDELPWAKLILKPQEALDFAVGVGTGLNLRL